MPQPLLFTEKKKDWLNFSWPYYDHILIMSIDFFSIGTALAVQTRHSLSCFVKNRNRSPYMRNISIHNLCLPVAQILRDLQPLKKVVNLPVLISAIIERNLDIGWIPECPIYPKTQGHQNFPEIVKLPKNSKKLLP